MSKVYAIAVIIAFCAYIFIGIGWSIKILFSLFGFAFGGPLDIAPMVAYIAFLELGRFAYSILKERREDEERKQQKARDLAARMEEMEDEEDDPEEDEEDPSEEEEVHEPTAEEIIIREQEEELKKYKRQWVICAIIWFFALAVMFLGIGIRISEDKEEIEALRERVGNEIHVKDSLTNRIEYCETHMFCK